MEITIKSFSPLTGITFWKHYLVHMRPYLLFVSGIAGIMGLAMNSAAGSEWWKTVVASLVFFFGYGFGQALTDCFQTDTDKLSAPYRPLSKGLISKRSVFIVSIAGLMASAVALFALHLMSFILSALAVVGLASYSFVKKKFWWGGPFHNAWIVALLPLMGYYALLPSTTFTFPFSLILFPLISFFSYTSFVLIGYLKDIDADKATGYKTFPVVFGWKTTVIAGDVIALFTLSAFWLISKGSVMEILTALAGTLIIIYGQLYAHMVKNENPEASVQPVLSTVRSFILLHISLVIHFQPHWWWFTVLFYLCFEVFLMKRPCHSQI